MSDFETRLTEALTSGAEQAPEVHGLVDGARTRAKARRRTRYATVAAVVVGALAIPAGVLALNGDGEGSSEGPPIANDPTTEQTYTRHEFKPVEYDGVTVNIPGNWYELDTSSCEFQWVRYAPLGVDPCDYEGPNLSFYSSATFDPATDAGQIGYQTGLEGLAGGYVYAGDWAVYMEAEGSLTVTNTLASVRTNDYDWPERSFVPLETETYDGLAIDVPVDWKEGGLGAWCLDKGVSGWVERPGAISPGIACTPSAGYGIRFGVGAPNVYRGFEKGGSPEYPEDSWAGVAVVPNANGRPAGAVLVVAPTEGLAQVIGGSLRVQ